MSLILKNIKDLEGDSWRTEFNGENIMVHCDECEKVEDEVKEMYMFHTLDNSFFDGKYIFCDCCVTELKRRMQMFLLEDVV